MPAAPPVRSRPSAAARSQLGVDHRRGRARRHASHGVGGKEEVQPGRGGEPHGHADAAASAYPAAATRTEYSPLGTPGIRKRPLPSVVPVNRVPTIATRAPPIPMPLPHDSRTRPDNSPYVCAGRRPALAHVRRTSARRLTGAGRTTGRRGRWSNPRQRAACRSARVPRGDTPRHCPAAVWSRRRRDSRRGSGPRRPPPTAPMAGCIWNVTAPPTTAASRPPATVASRAIPADPKSWTGLADGCDRARWYTRGSPPSV